MDFQTYVQDVTRGFPCSKREQQAIREELMDHLEMLRQEFTIAGYDSNTAVAMAMDTLGDAYAIRDELLDSLPLVDTYWRRWVRIVGATYLLGLVYALLLAPQRFAERSFIRTRETLYPEYSYVFHNGVPFRTIARYIVDFHDYGFHVTLAVLGGGILLYVPIGLLLPMAFTDFQRILSFISVVFVVSVSIQLIQGIFMLGRFDVDTILLNCLGGVIGFCCYRLLVHAVGMYKSRLIGRHHID